MANNIRPTKKQKELLEFIKSFIAEHGYSPSYREIMNGLKYTSVATVALHVNSLIKRGHLRKRDRSARSLEVVANVDVEGDTTPHHESDVQWLVQKIEQLFAEIEQVDQPLQAQLDKAFVLVGALKVLDFHEAAEAFMPRLQAIKEQIQ
jgi:SOS-response transcriptional repressor LexA